MVLFGDFLRPQVLFDGHRVVGAALHGRIIGDDHALHTLHTADACDEARRGRVAIVHPEAGACPARCAWPAPPLRRPGPCPSLSSSGRRPEPASCPRWRGTPMTADLFVSSMPAFALPPD